jgi:CxxC motif-containing protein (DUF1111 family)
MFKVSNYFCSLLLSIKPKSSTFLKQLILSFLGFFILSFSLTSSNISATERNPGGQHTHQKPASRFSFSHPSPALSMDKRLDFYVGKAIFEKIWVFSPSSTTASDGLGPLYNARSCVRCHKGNGRGMIEGNKSSSPALFLRLSIPPATAEHRALLASGKVGFITEPTYGKQLQTFAHPGGKAEGQLEVQYKPIKIGLNGGDIIEIQQPSYHISDLGYGPIHHNFLLSPRIAPPIFGLGLLEAIDENDIFKLADSDDKNNDGISGKANIVWDKKTKTSKLGRFGWKAGTPFLEQQNNAALSGDLGISSWMFPQHHGECTKRQTACLQQKHGNMRRDKPKQDMLEASRVMTDLLLYYTRNIAVPSVRLINDLDRKKGKELFYKAGCQKCHQPSFTTGKFLEQTSLESQTIWPYSDLLLHDMGIDLADNRSEFLANGQEWRTPPLWGIGLTKTVSGGTFYMHDGRARSLIEAILWHGGEAESAKQMIIKMNNKQRKQLISFLESL